MAIEIQVGDFVHATHHNPETDAVVIQQFVVTEISDSTLFKGGELKTASLTKFRK